MLFLKLTKYFAIEKLKKNDSISEMFGMEQLKHNEFLKIGKKFCSWTWSSWTNGHRNINNKQQEIIIRRNKYFNYFFIMKFLTIF